MDGIITLRTFTESEYHEFFRNYEPDPLMDPHPFVYNAENVSCSYKYNYDCRNDYLHYGIFLEEYPVGAFQLKRINFETSRCEFGIILQSDKFKNQGIGTKAISLGIDIAQNKLHIHTIIGDTAGRNKRMQRVFDKLGFHLVETVPNAFDFGIGDLDDRLVYQKELIL